MGFLPSVSIYHRFRNRRITCTVPGDFLEEMPGYRARVCRDRLISMMEPSGHKISKEYFAPGGAPSPLAPEISHSETILLLLSTTEGEIDRERYLLPPMLNSARLHLWALHLRAVLLLFFFKPPVMRATSSFAICSPRALEPSFASP